MIVVEDAVLKEFDQTHIAIKQEQSLLRKRPRKSNPLVEATQYPLILYLSMCVRAPRKTPDMSRSRYQVVCEPSSETKAEPWALYIEVIWGFPKIRGTLLGFPIRRIIVYLGLY